MSIAVISKRTSCVNGRGYMSCLVSTFKLKILIYRWSNKTHTFIISWGELLQCSRMSFARRTSLYSSRQMPSGVELSEDDHRKMMFLTTTKIASKATSWLYGGGTDWLSWNVLSSKPKDGLNQSYSISYTIAKGAKFFLAPLYFGSLTHG